MAIQVQTIIIQGIKEDWYGCSLCANDKLLILQILCMRVVCMHRVARSESQSKLVSIARGGELYSCMYAITTN